MGDYKDLFGIIQCYLCLIAIQIRGIDTRSLISTSPPNTKCRSIEIPLHSLTRHETTSQHQDNSPWGRITILKLYPSINLNRVKIISQYNSNSKLKLQMLSKYKERAIPLISVDPTSGKYVLTQEASEFIRNVPGPIGVVSVAGLYRTGKSYLLNQMLLNRSNGFGVGPTINPCTKGLWCWGTPIKGETPQGEKLNIIVIDTEGIGALDEDQTHDTRIFTLAILASSCFIYNSVGSIDQNAVQNLSLVVNLTKHIQVRTQKYVEEEDPDKIATHFPTFFWVVRDFSLQIADSEGNKMTSKQYLEKALAPQKGFSEDIEQKNRIRRMLTSFFKERECFTLVRPLIEQSKLQDLDKMSFDDLRPEFVNQVINFRKRVTGRMKPKTLNGQKLSGELYLSMLNSYVGAINDGAVPNIENAWNYMCQEQCTKVMVEAMEKFETGLREIKIPCSAEEISKGIEEAEEAAYQQFKKKSIGDDAEKYYKELQKKMRERTKELRKVNTQQGKSAFKKYIAPFAATIQQKISKEQFAGFEDFLEELKKLEQKVTKEGPNYVDSNLHCQICINKILGQGVTYLFKRMKNEREQIKKTLEERIKINENEVDSLKRERDSQQSNMREKLALLDREKIQMTFKLEKIQIELDRTTKERFSEEETLSKNLNAKKAEIEQVRREFEAKIAEANSKVEEATKNFHSEQSNWEKEKAIYELKVRQQTEKLEDLEKKLQNSSTKLALEANELSQKHREQTLKLQDQIQQLMKNLNDSREKCEKLEEIQLQMREKMTALTEKFETTDRKLREETSSRAREVERLRNEHESEVNRVRNEMMMTRDEGDKASRQLEERLKKQEGRARELAEELKNVRNRYEKDNQVLSQELEFAKRGFEESKQKLVEMKAIYQGKIAAIEADSGLQREQQTKRKIAQLKSTHEQQLRTMQSEFKQTQRATTFQIDNLTRIKNELQLNIKVASEQLANERLENEETKQKLDQMTKKLEEEMRAAQRDKVTELLGKEKMFNERIADLEKELEEVREKYQTEKLNIEEKSALDITTLKNTYEVREQSIDARYNEEKDKLKKTYKQMVQKYERRIQEDQDSHEEELERIQSEYEEENRVLNATLTQLTHEKETLAREKVNLEQKLNALNEKHLKMETDLNDRLQKLIETTKAERENMVRKLEELQFNKNEMEKTILSLTHERDQFRSQSQKQSIEIEEMKSYNNNLTDRYEKTKSSLEERLKDSQDKYMKEKSKFDTENALLQQKKDFAEQKIAEIEKDLKLTKEREFEQMKALKDRHEEEMSNLTAKSLNERKLFEQKIEKLKKASAEAEATLLRQLSELSKAKAVDEQKIEYLDRKLMETESKTSVQIATLTEQLRALRERFSTETAQLKTRINELQETIHTKESELTDTKNSYDIKIALNEITLKNLQSWGETAVAQKNEMIRNLEKQLDESRKRNENEKSTQQLTHQEILTKMESKYRGEITFLSQEVTKKTQDIEYMNKESERAIKDLNERLAVERQTRMSLEVKVNRVENDFLQKESKLTAEIDKLRNEKDVLTLETQKLISKEKQLSKMKISEFERRMLESDRQKQLAIFDKEKQQAKWKMEKNSLEEKIDELRDQFEREQNENKRMMKDNEKLKAERKKNTSFIKNQTTIMTREVPVENKENNQMQ